MTGWSNQKVRNRGIRRASVPRFLGRNRNTRKLAPYIDSTRDTRTSIIDSMTAIFEVDCYSETTIFVWPLHLGNVLPEITVYTHSTRHRYITSQSSPIALKHLKHLDRGSMEIKRPRFTEFYHQLVPLS